MKSSFPSILFVFELSCLENVLCVMPYVFLFIIYTDSIVMGPELLNMIWDHGKYSHIAMLCIHTDIKWKF